MAATLGEGEWSPWRQSIRPVKELGCDEKRTFLRVPWSCLSIASVWLSKLAFVCWDRHLILKGKKKLDLYLKSPKKQRVGQHAQWLCEAAILLWYWFHMGLFKAKNTKKIMRPIIFNETWLSSQAGLTDDTAVQAGNMTFLLPGRDERKHRSH